MNAMRKTRIAKLVPNLRYTDKAEEAAAFDASTLPNSNANRVTFRRRRRS
jgi:predicted 3-demethylubiquinone-9 3-methyltransferase (glyoxalase superfamily)